LHSEFSIVDGLVRIDDIVPAAKNDQQPALAITDLSNLFGMVKFYKARAARASSQSLDAMSGSPTTKIATSRRVAIAVKDRSGYLQLCELLSQAWLTNQHRAAPIEDEWLENGAAVV